MKHRIFDMLLAFIVGALTTIGFFSLYGLIASYSIENKLSHCIFRLPKDYRVFSFYIHEIILQILSILPLVAVYLNLMGLRPTKIQKI